jgi:hypothetical protein
MNFHSAAEAMQWITAKFDLSARQFLDDLEALMIEHDATGPEIESVRGFYEDVFAADRREMLAQAQAFLADCVTH